MNATNPMVSAVSRYEDAARAAEAALDTMYASFGIENRRIVSVGGEYIPGTDVDVHGCRVMQDAQWRVEKYDGCLARLCVRSGSDEFWYIMESARLCDGFGNVGYVVDVLGEEFRKEFVLVVLTCALESK